MPIWYPFVMCFLITLSFTASLLSDLDCKFIQIRLPYKGKGNSTQVEYEEFGLGLGLLSFEIISVDLPRTTNVDITELILTNKISTKRKCIRYGYDAKRSVKNDVIGKAKFYTSENTDKTLSSIRICALLSIVGLFLACLTIWSVVFKCMCGKSVPQDYGPRNTLYGETVKKMRNRFICFILILVFCIITEGMKFRFTGIDLCLKGRGIIAFSESGSYSEAGLCSPDRGFYLAIISFSSLAVATVLSLIC